MNREDHAVTQFAGDLVAVLVSREESRQSVWRDIRLDRVGIEPVARESHGVPVDVRGENLKLAGRFNSSKASRNSMAME